jgi:hypothetical protein
MQQTQNLNLNLIESTDPVDWSPLNANMETIEAAFATQAADTLSLVGSGGKNCRIATGTYTGDGTYGEKNKNSLTFDFAPLVVLVSKTTDARRLVLPWGKAYTSGSTGYGITMECSGRTLTWWSANNNGQNDQMNESDTEYRWFVIGYDDGQ